MLEKKKLERLELKRQLFHIAFGLSIVLLLYIDFIDAFILFSLLVASVGLSFLSKKMDIPIVSWFLNNFERPSELKKLPGKGAIFFLIGVLIVLIIPFGKNVALASIMILTLGDSVSHLVGRFYGQIKHPFNPKLMLEGTLAGTAAAFFGALFFVSPLEALLASSIAMAAEAIEFRVNEREADDNITIPFIAAIVIFLFRLF